MFFSNSKLGWVKLYSDSHTPEENIILACFTLGQSAAPDTVNAGDNWDIQNLGL